PLFRAARVLRGLRPQWSTRMSISLKKAVAATALCLMSATGWARAVSTESGALTGVRQHGLTIYKGVPYAAPPWGELRWREPRPVSKWKGTRRADTFAPACLQNGVSMPGETPPATSE